jgi:hypothetical protein
LLRSDYAISLAILALLALLVFVSIRQLNPPTAVAENAPSGEFSSGRALKHLAVIAGRPHPSGSAAHAETRDYIMRQLGALGLSPEVQRTPVVGRQQGSAIPAATVENIVARLKGAAVGQAVLIVGHYDSVPTSNGASDDGAAVAAMLETARALKSGAPLRNDVIFLFTDCEEVGLLGAKAFTDEHPLAKDVAIVLNFEARGNGGPSIMFETSAQNGGLIKEFAGAAPHPLADSLSYEIYKRLPNDTDLSVFKRAGLKGLNFAFINGVNHYHTSLDRIEYLDERSLQHQGSYALALARRFGNLDLPVEQESDAVYFSLAGAALVHYPQSMVMPLSAVAVLLWVAVVWLGLKRGEVSYGGTGLGFLVFPLNLIAAWLLVTGLWWVVRLAQPGYDALPIVPYNDGFYLMGFLALTVALNTALYLRLQSRVSVGSLTAGALLWWLLLLIVVSFFIPGGSYLLTWPLLSGLVSLAAFFLLNGQRRNSVRLKMTLLACAAPGILLMAPLMYLLHVALAIQAAGLLVVLTVLLLGSLIPLISLTAGRSRWILPGASALAGVALVLIAFVTSGFDTSRPKPDSVFYALNTDSGRAVWASADQEADQWTAQFLDGKSNRGSIEEYAPLTYKGFLTGEAPPASLDAPSLTVLGDDSDGGVRTLRLRVASQRQAPVIGMYVEQAGEDLKAEVNGKGVERADGDRLAVRYFAPGPEGVELTLRFKQSTPIKLRVMDQTYGLPQLPNTKIKERTDNLMLSSYPYADSTLVSRTFAL